MKKTAKIFLLPVLLIVLATTLTSCSPDPTIIYDTEQTRVRLVNETTHDTIVAGRTDISISITIGGGSSDETGEGDETPYLVVRNGDILSMQCLDIDDDIQYTIIYSVFGQRITSNTYPYKVEMTVSGMEMGLYGASVTGSSVNISTDSDEEIYLQPAFEEENILQVIE
ncbi:MAG TPA: hypothetical protein IAA88_08710 [Candidatus Avimuribaculum pullicola]|nr:hypothetical protein [Candidatus Avimuribaculum pullicola]